MMHQGLPRIAIITQDGPEQRYVANVLCDAFDVAAIMVDVSERPTLRERVRRLPLRARISKVIRTIYLTFAGDRTRSRRSMIEILGDRTRRFEHEHLVVTVDGLRSAALVDQLNEVRPDIIAVYGCGIVPDSVLRTARVAALNMHTGLSPWYRGTHCAFWPIANGEPQMIGSTVHACTSDVDHGALYERVRPQLHPNDDLHAVFARCVEAGADAYVRAIRAVMAGDRGQMPEVGGRTYRASERGIGAELRARRQIRGGLLRRHVMAVADPASAVDIPEDGSQIAYDAA